MIKYLKKKSIPKNFESFNISHSHFTGCDYLTCKEIGGWFVSTDSCNNKNSFNAKYTPFIPSLKHGRACAVCLNPDKEDEWVSIKGIGWTYGGFAVLPSSKDHELVFGLYDKKSAQREYSVSNKLNTLKIESPVVLGFVTLTPDILPEQLKKISSIKYKNGRDVESCLLYTKVKSPFRITDLQFMGFDDRKRIITKTANLIGTDYTGYIERFANILGKKIAEYHNINCVNDLLDAGNITLCAEIVDYEWFTIPDIPLPDGSLGLQKTEERREKEIIYAIESLLLLNNYLNAEYCFWDLADLLIKGYEQLYQNNKLVELIKMRKTLVLTCNYENAL